MPEHCAIKQKLSESDQDELFNILNFTIEYIDHPIFHQGTYPKHLFKSRVEHFDNAERTWNRILARNPESTPKNAKDSRYLMTKDEERLIFCQYNYAKYITYRLQQKGLTYSLETKEAYRMLRWWRFANECYRTITVTNLGLVQSMYERIHHNEQIDPIEVIADGQNALLRSIIKFDVSKGLKFSTYACNAIHRRMSRFVEKKNRNQLREHNYDFHDHNHVSSQNDIESVESQDEMNFVLQLLEENEAGLSPEELVILKQRYGLNQEREPQTLKIIGNQVGLTKERVRQIEKRAFYKLRECMNVECVQ